MTTTLIAFISVLLLNAYALVLVRLRAAVYHVPLYRPMILNIGLSFAPVLVASIGSVLVLAPAILLSDLAPRALMWTIYAVLAVVTLVWLLFFPNSVYLITELNFSHRDPDDPVPLWYDIIQTLTLTLSGIANAVLSLGVVQSVFLLLFVDPTRATEIPFGSWLFAGAVVALGAVGVYLGRYLRFNSWDVRHPVSLVRKLVAHLRERGKALEAAAFVLTHAVLLGLVYVPVYLMALSALMADL